MKTVARLLSGRQRPVLTISRTTSAYEAVQLMATEDIGALLIVDGDQVVGIVSERDLARKLALQERPARDVAVGELMTARVLYVRPDQTIEECMALMTERHVRHLPVMDHGRLLGVISIRDVVADMISEKQFMIEQLENYITGRYA